MNQEELLNALKCVVLGVAKLLGPDTEVVLHDLERREMVYIVNGSITDRKIGYKLNPSVYDTVLSLADADGHMVGYGSHAKNGKNLRSSHIIIHDSAKVPRALICINQDTSKLENARNLIDSMIRLQPLSTDSEPAQENENYIQSVTQRVIVNAIERMKPTVFETKEAKLEVLRELELKGVFAVKDAVPTVCRLLEISQATLYNYLRELRSQSVAAPAPTALKGGLAL